jgi:glutamate-1-semialdehyde 2,1-aminomutase/spore coat polysaccharide biosynthesis protein SpsF
LTTAVIVQARMGSSRLPGKIMLNLAGKPVLQHVLERCGRIAGSDALVCAIADEREAGQLADAARRWGAQVFVGPERDVLARYRDAARMVNADVIVRVTSDCPLIDPAVCARVIALGAETGAGYASNIAPRSYPKGLDCEVFTASVLERAAAVTDDPFDREHVTQWMQRSPDVAKANLSSGNASLANHRWTLDYPEDLEFLRRVLPLLPDPMASMPDILALLAAHPDLLAINAALMQSSRERQTPPA